MLLRYARESRGFELRRFFKLRAFFGALSLVLLPASFPSDAFACRLGLVLAIDVSRSIDSAEYALQFRGLASAFRDERIQAAILAEGRPVAVSAFQWSGTAHQEIVANWSLLLTPDDVENFAVRLEGQGRTKYGQKTAIGSALEFGHELLARVPNCSRLVMDVSGDGYNNEGPRPAYIYQVNNFSGVTVNALVIGGLVRPKLTRYFEEVVIRGSGAFAISTRGFVDYFDAIRRKLLRELKDGDVVAEAALGGRQRH